MDLQIKDQLFLVTGASSGLGRAIAETLLAEGASIVAVARRGELLADLAAQYPGKVKTLAIDITDADQLPQLLELLQGKVLHGALINAGGPPAKQVMETTLADWDTAYTQLLRWKVDLTQHLLPLMEPQGYGRLLYLESASVKQPIENLVLSTSLRMAVVGFVKTLSQEMSRSNINFNIIAPGSHDTAAIERIYKKKSEQTSLPQHQVRQAAIEAMPMGRLGQPADFAQLAVWLLSPASRFITGQVHLVDGGTVKGN